MEAILGCSLGVFIGLTLIITGGAAIMTGRALADRFLVYALFEGPLLHLAGFVTHFLAITALALLAHRITAVRKMVNQYPWRYERASLFAYREKAGQT
jgi:hypothetical protein